MTNTPFHPGTHLLIDHYDGQHLNDAAQLEAILRAAAKTAGAAVLKTSFHPFPDRAGVTGFVLLAESHISIHTWPEHGFAAIDIFMCGACDPHVAAKYLEQVLAPKRVEITQAKRGAF